MLTTEPVPPSALLASRCGTAAWVRLCATTTLNRNAFSRCRGVVARNGRGSAPPTLLTTMSSRPKASTAAAASPAAASGSLRSAGTTTARRPAASTSRATAASWPSVRAEITTSAPAWARATAVAAPIPRPAPVITATRPVTRKRSPIMGPASAGSVRSARAGAPARLPPTLARPPPPMLAQGRRPRPVSRG